MTRQSARSMMWASLGLLLVGGMIGSPEAGVAVSILAGCCSLVTIVYGSKGIRIVAVLTLAAALGLAAALFPAAQKDMAGYREHAHSTPHAAASAPAGAQ